MRVAHGASDKQGASDVVGVLGGHDVGLDGRRGCLHGGSKLRQQGGGAPWKMRHFQSFHFCKNWK